MKCPGSQLLMPSLAPIFVNDLTELGLAPLQPRLAGFYSTPPGQRNDEHSARHQCSATEGRFSARMSLYRARAREAMKWNRFHWTNWQLHALPHQQKIPRVPHLFSKVRNIIN